MNYEIVEVSEKTILGLMTKTTNQNMQAVKEIGTLWNKFLNESYSETKCKRDDKVMGIYTDYEGDFTMPYNFIAGCEVMNTEDIQQPLVVRKIPSGKYAKFSAQGHCQSIVAEMWEEIWKTKLDRKYSYDFEVYHCNPANEKEQKIDIYISLK